MNAITMQVLLVNVAGTIEHATAEALRSYGGDVASAGTYLEAVQRVRSGSIDAIIITEPVNQRGDESEGFETLMRLTETQRLATLLVTDRGGTPPKSRTLLSFVRTDVTPEELRGRLTTIDRYHDLLRGLEEDLDSMQRLGKRLNRQFHEVDQEMRLASRLQRAFLPDLTEPIENVQFASVYRPASWVSGDIFDAFRVDEDHVGFYLADAVGHGMAASLLTMFIKQTIVPKRISGDSYEVCSPSEAIGQLNDAIAEQELPNCQFVTACYGLLNTRTLELQCARGGHPYPLLIDTQGVITEIRSSGGLLGMSRGGDFPTTRTRLKVGDKVLLYSDGMETGLVSKTDRTQKDAYRGVFEDFAHLGVSEMLMHIEAKLDRESGSITPRDDITLLGLEVLGR